MPSQDLVVTFYTPQKLDRKIGLLKLISIFHDFQDSLYQKLKESVHGFRELVGAPDTPRWNSVLFGGKTTTKLMLK